MFFIARITCDKTKKLLGDVMIYIVVGDEAVYHPLFVIIVPMEQI